jgi:hypothetical protein
VSATAFVARPATFVAVRAALFAAPDALRAVPPDLLPPFFDPPVRLLPVRREDDDVPPDLRLPLGLIKSAAVGLTPSTVLAADSSAVLATLDARSATSPATFVT